MASQSLTNFDAILKNVYRGPIVEQLNQESYAIDQFERVAANDMGAFSGRKVIFPIHVARNRGRGAITDGGTLPTAGTQSYADGEVTIRYFVQGIELTDQVIKQSESNEGAFVRAMTSEIEGATTDLRKDINRQVYGSGDGTLTAISGAVTSGSKTSLNVASTQYVAVGDTVDVIDTSAAVGSQVVATVTVTGVTTSGTAGSSTQGNGSISFASTSIAAISSGNGAIALSGSYGTGANAKESDGFRNITSTSGSLHNLNPSTYSVWAGSEIDANYTTASTPTLEDLFIQLAQTIRKKSAKSPDVYLTTLGAQRRLSNQYTSQKRWNDASVLKVDGGYSAIMVAAGANPIPVVADVDAPTGYAFALRKDSFAWTELQKPDWLSAPDGKGSILSLKTTGSTGQRSATWQAWLGWYSALACVARNQNGRIINLADDNPVARV